jgi:hypothetical protein
MNQEAPPDRIQIAAQFMAALLPANNDSRFVNDTTITEARWLSQYAFMLADQFLIAAGIGCPKRAATDKMFEVLKLLCYASELPVHHPQGAEYARQAQQKAVETFIEIKHAYQKQKETGK